MDSIVEFAGKGGYRKTPRAGWRVCSSKGVRWKNCQRFAASAAKNT